jgi:hypothetical protein
MNFETTRKKNGITRNLYNYLAKPFTTVGADPFYAQTSGLRPPKFLQAYLKLAAEESQNKNWYLEFFHEK